MGRRKKVVEEPEDEVLLAEEETPRAPLKPFHWSDDGPRYNVMVELPDSVVGTRHYGTFFETEELAEAKKVCLEKFTNENKTTLIHDRAERNSEIVGHEAIQSEIKDEPEPEKVKPTRTRKTVKRKT